MNALYRINNNQSHVWTAQESRNFFDLIMAPDIFKRMAVEERNRNIIAGVTEKRPNGANYRIIIH